MLPSTVRRVAVLSFSSLALLSLAADAQQWTPATPAELTMSSLAEVPGAPAVYLFREQISDDSLHMKSFYARIKILTEAGKEYANVELPYNVGSAGLNIDSIAGRTIQPDGTVVPFTGKPYEKLIAKSGGLKVKAKVFSLPAVQVGSIIEYRYKEHFDDNFYIPEQWFVQSDLFTRKAHYMWRPTERYLTSEDGRQVSTSVAWTPILPAGAAIKQTTNQIAKVAGGSDGSTQLDLDVHDIPPIAHEQYMPPIASLSYRVLFYYTAYRTLDEYWTKEGKHWAKVHDKFIGPGPAVSEAAHSLAAPGDSADKRLRSLYAAVMQIENTDFTRQHTGAEERADGLKAVNSTEDVWTRKRGSGDQIAELLVGLARAAGFKAYLMAVADRSERIFLQNYLSFGQLDDLLAIVNVDGKEVYLDPGQRFCTYDHLSWKHAYTGGLRQTDGGVQLSGTPSSTYKETKVQRIADLELDDRGVATGMVSLTLTGDSALHWRQEGLRGDDTSLNADLRQHLEQMMPGGMEVRVTKVDNLADGEKALFIKYEVKGAVGSSTGKRLLVPAYLFEANAKPHFPEAKRELPIDMHYAQAVQDAVRYKLPPGIAIESTPEDAEGVFGTAMAFKDSSQRGKNSITLFRNVTSGRVLYTGPEYADLRKFYGKLEAKDGESLVLTHAPATAEVVKPAGN